MEQLKSLLSVLDANSTSKQVESIFNNVAEMLLNDYHIVKGDEEYYFVKIEFYFCNKNHLDLITYPRSVGEGKWFFHPSGIDLTFRSSFSPYHGDKTVVDVSKEFFFGGILVRDILKRNGNEFFCGPYKCEWELFDVFDAVSPNIYEIPRVVRNKEHLGLGMCSASRHFSYDDEKIEKKYEELTNKTFLGGMTTNEKEFYSYIKEKNYAYMIDRKALMQKLSGQ